jgi:hypothetical protein
LQVNVQTLPSPHIKNILNGLPYEWVNDLKMEKDVSIQNGKRCFYKMKYPMSEWVNDWMVFHSKYFHGVREGWGGQKQLYFIKFTT